MTPSGWKDEDEFPFLNFMDQILFVLVFSLMACLYKPIVIK